jgi:Domain of unknown function (DUF4352)
MTYGRGGAQQPWEEQPYPQQGYDQQYPQEQPWQPQRYEPYAHQRRIQGAPQVAPWQQAGYAPPVEPWRPPDYGQSHPAQPQYSPGTPQPPRGRRRKRHLVRNVLAGLGALVVAIIAISVAANGGGHSVNTTGTSGGANTPGGGNAAAKVAAAGIGSTITLSGDNTGEQMAVTVTKVISDAKPGDEFSSPDSGKRLYAVQFRLKDAGSAAYSDSPSNGAAVVDSIGQSYQASLDNAAGCQSFPGTENIAVGATGLGCIVFEVPEAAKITEVQFTLDSGFGPQTGQWSVR